jgi:hypothetical protein
MRYGEAEHEGKARPHHDPIKHELRAFTHPSIPISLMCDAHGREALTYISRAPCRRTIGADTTDFV